MKVANRIGCVGLVALAMWVVPTGPIESIILAAIALISGLYAGIRGSRWWLMLPITVLALVAVAVYLATLGH